MGGFQPVSPDEFWGDDSFTSTPSGVRSAEDVRNASPYDPARIGDRKVWTEEELQSSLGTGGGLWGFAQRALDAPALPFRALQNTVGDMLGLSKPAEQGNLTEAASVWSGLGHVDPETGQVSGQATFAPGHGMLGDKLEAAVAGSRKEKAGVDPFLEAIPGGVLYKALPEELKKLPRAVLDAMVRTGAQLAGGIMEDPGALAGTLGASALGKQAVKAGTRKAYLASELAQKGAGGAFVARGVGDSAKEAKDAFDRGDFEGAVRAGSHAVSQILLGGLLVKGGIEDAKFAKGLPEEAPPAAAAAPAPAAPRPTASSVGEYPDPSALVPPPRTQGPGDYPDPSEYMTTPPPPKPMPEAAPPPPTPTTTYRGQPVTVVGRAAGNRITIQLADGTKRRVAASQVQGLQRAVSDEEAAAAIAERNKPEPGYEQDPTPERVAEMMQPGKGGDDVDLDQLMKEIDDATDESLQMSPAPIKPGTQLTPEQALDLVWDTVEKGRQRATSKMRTFGGIFSPREAEGANLLVKTKPKLVLTDKTKELSLTADGTTLRVNPEWLKRYTAGLPPEVTNRILIDAISHEVTHKLRTLGAAYNPITGEEAGRINPSRGHAKGGITDSPLTDVEHMRTQARLARMANARARQGGLVRHGDLRIGDASFNKESLDLAREIWGESATKNTVPNRDTPTKLGEISSPPKRAGGDLQATLSRKDYSDLPPSTLSKVFDTQFQALRSAGVPTGAAVRRILQEVSSAYGGKIPKKVNAALKELLGREKSVKAGKPFSPEEAKSVLDAVDQRNIAGNFDPRDNLRDLLRIKDPQNLPKELYLKYKQQKIRVGQRIRAAAERLGARGMDDPRIKEAIDLYNELPKLKEGSPGMDPALREALTPPPAPKPAKPAKPAPVIKARPATQRQLGINPREIATSGRQTGPDTPAQVAGLIKDAADLNKRWNALKNELPTPENLAKRKELSTLAKQRTAELRERASRAQGILAKSGAEAPPVLQRLINSANQMEEVTRAIDASITKVDKPSRVRASKTTMEDKMAGQKIQPPPTEALPRGAKPDDPEIDLSDDMEITLPEETLNKLKQIAEDNRVPEDIRRQAAAAVVEGQPQRLAPELRKFRGLKANWRDMVGKILEEELEKVGTEIGRRATGKEGDVLVGGRPRGGYTREEAIAAATERIKALYASKGEPLPGKLIFGRPAKHYGKKIDKPYTGAPRPVSEGRWPIGRAFKDSPEGIVTKGQKAAVEAEGRIPAGRAEEIIALAESERKQAPAAGRTGGATAVSALDVAKRRKDFYDEVWEAVTTPEPKPTKARPMPTAKTLRQRRLANLQRQAEGETTVRQRILEELEKKHGLVPPPPSDRARAALRAKPNKSLLDSGEGKKQLSDTGGREVVTSRRAVPFSKRVTKFFEKGNFYRTALQSAQAAKAAIRKIAAGSSPEDALRVNLSRADRALVLEDIKAGRSLEEITERLDAKITWAQQRLAAGKGNLPKYSGEGRPRAHGQATAWTYEEYRKARPKEGIEAIPELDPKTPIKVIDADGKEIGTLDAEKGILTKANGKQVDLVNKVYEAVDDKGKPIERRYGSAITTTSLRNAIKYGGATKNFILRDEAGNLIRMELPGRGGKVVHAAGGIVIDPETKQPVGKREGGSETKQRIPEPGTVRKGTARLLDDETDDITMSREDRIAELPEAVRKGEARLQGDWADEADVEALEAATRKGRTFAGEATTRRRRVEVAGGAPSVWKSSTGDIAEKYHRGSAGYREDKVATKRAEPVYEDPKSRKAGEEVAGKIVRPPRRPLERPVRTGPTKRREYTRAVTEEEMAARRAADTTTMEGLDLESKQYSTTVRKGLGPRLAPKPTETIDPKRVYQGYQLKMKERATPSKVDLETRAKAALAKGNVKEAKRILNSWKTPEAKKELIRTYLTKNPKGGVSLTGLAIAVKRGRITEVEFNDIVAGEGGVFDSLFDLAVKQGIHKPSQRTAFIQAAQRELRKFNPRTKTQRVAPLKGENRDAWFNKNVRTEMQKAGLAIPEEAKGLDLTTRRGRAAYLNRLRTRDAAKMEPPPKADGDTDVNDDMEMATAPLPSQSASPVKSTTKATQIPLFSNLPKGTPPPPTPGPAKRVYDSLSRSAGHVIEESNALRALASSGDFSAPFRQAVIYTFAHPVKAAKRSREMVRAWTEKNHDALSRKMQQDPDFNEAAEAGVNFVHGTGQHEAFHGAPIIQKRLKSLGAAGRAIGGMVAGSERSYTYYQNAALLDVYKAGKEFLKSTGEWNKNSAEELAKFANDAVSRTKIPLGEGAQKILTGVFFSPQMQASRARILTDPFGLRYDTKAGKFARRELGRAMATGLALMTAAYASADAAGLDPSMEWDPRSSDFGKVRVGNATIDVWGGYQQMVRATAQFLSGQYKSVSTGRTQKRDRLDTLVQFVRSKLAPAPSLALTVATGKDMIGREAHSPAGLGRAVANSAAPMAGRDLVELYKESPAMALAAAVPLLMGMNVNAGLGRKGSYVDSPSIREADQRVSDEVRRLKLMPPSLSRRISLPGRNRIGQKYYTTLSGKEWEDFEKEAMPEVVDLLDTFIKSESYKRLDDKAKTRALAARIRWVNRYKGASTKRRQQAIEAFRKGTLKPSNEWWEEEEE